MSGIHCIADLVCGLVIGAALMRMVYNKAIAKQNALDDGH